MVDPQKLKAAEQAALSDVNKAESWIDTHPRLAFAAALLVGLIVGYLVHFHK